MNRKWSEVEKTLIISNYHYMSDLGLCQLLEQNGYKHTLDSVRKYRQRLALKKNKGRRVKEGKEDIEVQVNQTEEI